MAEGHGLTGEQRALVDCWLGRFTIVADCSWPLQETTVLRLVASGDDLVVKANGHSVAREIAAHRHYSHRLDGLLPTLLHADVDARILVTRWLPGDVVDGTAAEWDPGTYRDAGAALDRLLEPLGVSDAWMIDRKAKTLSIIHRAATLDLVPDDDLRPLAARVDIIRAHPLRLFMTHGDYQPRNWLLDGDALRVIDLGRAQPRPWTSDLTRLRFRQFAANPALAEAFATGLGRAPTPEEVEAQVLEDIAEAIGTVVWAHDIGDGDFEAHGRRMIRRILAEH